MFFGGRDLFRAAMHVRVSKVKGNEKEHSASGNMSGVAPPAQLKAKIYLIKE